MRSRNLTRRSLLAALAAVSLLAAGLSSGVSSAAPTRTTSTLAPGVTLTRIVNSTGPKRAWTVEFVPSATAATLDVATPKKSLPGKALTSAMGTAHLGLAAINGDFGTTRPDHVLAQDADLWQTGVNGGANFAVAQDESAVYVGRPSTRVTAFTPAGQFQVDLWNQNSPTSTQAAGYSPRGGSAANPPSNACSVRLTKSGDRMWAANYGGVKQAYIVTTAPVCSSTAMAENGKVVLSTPTAGTKAPAIKALKLNDVVTVKWTLGWPKVLDSIGGTPMLVAGGVNVAPTTCTNCGRQPRTAIGVKADGTVVMAVLDGRRSGWSVGMTMTQWADFLIGEGVVNAVNLDGGGSTTMWISDAANALCQSQTAFPTATGCLVNKPSMDYERTVNTAVAVIPGADGYPTAEPVPTGP